MKELNDFIAYPFKYDRKCLDMQNILIISHKLDIKIPLLLKTISHNFLRHIIYNYLYKFLRKYL